LGSTCVTLRAFAQRRMYDHSTTMPSVLKGDELSRCDKQTTRSASVHHVKPDDPIRVGEWERIQ